MVVRMKRKGLLKRTAILCPACNQWSYISKVKEIDEDIGFPHWGYPICPRCNTMNKDFKYLYRLQSYVPRYLSEEHLYMVRRGE